MADKIVVLRGGRIEQVGAPLELYNAPANRFVAGFIGSPRMNFLRARVIRSDADEIQVAFGESPTLEAVLPVRGDGIAAGEGVSVGVRPEHLVLGPGNPGDIAFDATIDQLEQLGAACLVYCSLPGGEKITAQAPGQLRHQVGETVRVTLPSGEAHVFRQAEGEQSLQRTISKR